MDWHLNRALTNFRNEVNSRWPQRDKTSDGTIGDKDHQSTSSDHNPDRDGSVDAWDMDVDGVDVNACIAAAIKHESIQYVIYNRRITSRSKPGGLGTWHPYTGKNPHDKHVHFNTRESHEDSTKPWFEEDDLTQTEFNTLLLNALKNDAIAKQMRALPWQYTGGGVPTDMSTLNVLSGTYATVQKPPVAPQPVEVSGAEVAGALIAHPGFITMLASALADETARRMRE